MSKESPLFSIVIPTRNRAHLLQYSLKSALNQNFYDYEIIVSNNASTDNTKDIVHSLSNEKVRYVEFNDRVLYMYEHWEFATRLAKGKYITILCDDDVYFPYLLNKVARVINKSDNIKVITFLHAHYYSNDWEIPNERNTLKIPIFSGKIQTFNSRKVLTSMFQFKRQFIYAPSAIKAFYHKEIVKSIREKTNWLFYSIYPDIFAASATLFFTTKYTYIDEPLIISNRHSKCSTAQYQFYKNEDTNAYIEKFVPVETVLAPLRLVLFTNAICDALLQLKKLIGYDMKNYHLNWVNYLYNCYEEILWLKQYRNNIESALSKFWDFLARQPENIQNSVLYKIHIQDKNTYNHHNTLLTIKKHILHFLERFSLINRIGNFFLKNLGLEERDISRKYATTISGSKEGFTNIYECLQRIPYILSKYRKGIIYK